jgi:Lrp/AsnC family leucine-responsive transcriptional regulator
MRRLEREGFIKDYVARLDARRMGFDVLAFVEVSLERTNSEVLECFTQAIRNFKEVVDCQMVIGNFDYLLKVNVAFDDRVPNASWLKSSIRSRDCGRPGRTWRWMR